MPFCLYILRSISTGSSYVGHSGKGRMLPMPNIRRSGLLRFSHALVVIPFLWLFAEATFNADSARDAGAAPQTGRVVRAQEESAGNSSWTEAELLKPEDLAKTLRDARSPGPLLFHVGFRMLYAQAHIPGSEFSGPACEAEGLAQLKKRVARLPRKSEIVLYCGCCPWSHCPNLRPAFAALRRMGFTHVRALYLPQDFGHDWVVKGFAVQRGE
jgi:thiosulfate/3-mercaptopyruvate sulfurtransferase